MREIVLDTETTGFDPLTGHRIVEIGCVELFNHLPTGGTYHQYLNPERDMPEEAFRVHGLSSQFLSDKPVFAEVVADFLEFLGDSKLVIHNAEFDMKFINAELARLGFPPIPMTRTIDTVLMARRKFPGAQANLDALCRRFEIDNTHRTHHGALLDSELLAEVYLQLIGGRQPGLELGASKGQRGGAADQPSQVDRPIRAARPHDASPEELEAHSAFIGKLKKPIWLREPE
ncbi:DNA polymerase III subunit epsilon [Magnetospirillum moscoviense]|uniref:DNA polymerase III subunit epsilon n=1 Tax=Magnetospirillum moscoviense TaxID=1437059 RepID=A0A178MLM3_9PROT|nr:DNA polymerase III subunit epsilon [Magnetospirillum moscoviense]MBF0323827.1 DNA polymerase III subunit epsilon [Alphaproteobacteria bacterium]OAN49576.1 DNA polymerase III subunit epsilon [Magnetospirillum moscoviense]